MDGPDGAGKSTQVKRVQSWAEGQGLSFRVVGKWQVFEESQVPQARFLRGTTLDELRVCIAEMPNPARMLFLGWMNTLAAERARAAEADLVVLDGYWVKHAATELLAGCPEELVDAIVHAMAPVDSVVFFDVTPEEALRRKKGDITPYECGRDPQCRPESFLKHQAAVRDVMLDWAARRGWDVVRANTAEAAAQQLRKLLAPKLGVEVNPRPAVADPRPAAVDAPAGH
ncbi:thymidylate kinase [Streptomyces sp. NPDC051704]|uniref:thymidylate kinase n=1 Tax=Streptomyces sp. NPDC051704 TaxID=3365671 RepID=UPI0037AA382C